MKFSGEDYGFYNHMPAVEAQALLNDDSAWRSYFKFAFDRNPWDRQVSFYHHRYRRETTLPPFADFIHKDRRARLNNFEIYSIDGELAVDFVGRFETLEADLKHALEQVGLSLDGNCRGPRPRSAGMSVPIAIIMTAARAISSAAGMDGKSNCSTTRFEC